MNDTGTGNTLACDHPVVQRLVLDALRSFVRYAGVDGFRFDLAPVLGRDGDGFDPDAPLLRAMREDPEIGSRVLKRRSTNEELGAVTISIGLAHWERGETPACLLGRADQALYASKRGGRNRVTVAGGLEKAA